jgi:chromosomal replication initiation ATPase DnaA
MQGLEPAVGKTHFNTWLKSTKLLEDSAGIIVIGVPNHYAKSWIEQNALKKIREALIF